jgi:excinuclease UvrABC ATPase subunit
MPTEPMYRRCRCRGDPDVDRSVLPMFDRQYAGPRSDVARSRGDQHSGRNGRAGGRAGGREKGKPMSTATATDAQDSLHVADTHDLIRVHGARVNNLKDIHVELPKRRLTVFTGVSGSGKSSLVFATIAAESQRLINETYSAFLQGFMPSLARPEVDLLEGLTTAIIVDQERLGANPRSTVGTATDASAMLRILFSRLGDPYIGPQTAFSFNVPTRKASGVMSTDKGGRVEKSVVKDAVYLGGMCPRCEGMGNVSDIDLTALYDESKSLREGALTIPGYSMDGWYGRLFEGVGLPMDKPIASFTKKQLETMLYAEPTKINVEGINLTFDGIVPKIQKSMLSKDPEAMQPHVRRFVERAVTFQTCPECAGTRLTKEALSSKINGKNIADLCSMQISDLADWVSDLHDASVAPLLIGLQHLLDSFAEIGLGYLSLDRPASTLSGGEAQRTKMIRHLGSSLTDVTYVFDEPTIGLHPHDIERMNKLLLSCETRATQCSSSSTSPRRSPSPITSSTSARRRAQEAAWCVSRAAWPGCGTATRSPVGTSMTERH